MTGVRAVTSNQNDIYKNLEQVVRKYAATRFLRPIADHTREAFESAKEFVKRHAELVSASAKSTPRVIPDSIGDLAVQPDSRLRENDNAAFTVILDSGCGTGESTLHLARKFPGIPVIGIDKSAMRLNKAGNEHQLRHADENQPMPDNLSSESTHVIPDSRACPRLRPRRDLAAPPDSRLRENDNNSSSNAFWVRAELLDFWRLALEEVQSGRWKVLHHAVYYPNPWPKESEATRRFHLHPIFPTLLALSPTTELRTNWEIYAREFAEAARILADASTLDHTDARSINHADAGLHQQISCEPFDPVHPETAFERKYKEARQQLWRVLIKR